MNDLFIWPLSSSAAFGACALSCSSSAGTEHRSISPSCHHPDVCLALRSGSREEADRETALQLHVCSLQSPAGESPIGRHSQHQSHIISQLLSLCGLMHKILGVLRRKQRRMTLFTQLLYSLWRTYEPWPAASQSVFDVQLPRHPLAKPEAFGMWLFPVFELLALLWNNSYNSKSSSKTALNQKKDLVAQKLQV